MTFLGGSTVIILVKNIVEKKGTNLLAKWKKSVYNKRIQFHYAFYQHLIKKFKISRKLSFQ